MKKPRIIIAGGRPAKRPRESKAKRSAHRAADKLKPALKLRRWPPFVVAVATVVYTIFAVRQWYVMKEQLDVMQIDQRPWVQIEAARLDGIVLPDNSDTINIQFSFLVKNIGKTPALGIDGAFQGYVQTMKTFAQANALEAKACSGSKDYPARKGDSSLMPGESDTYHMGAGVSMKKALSDIGADTAERIKSAGTPAYAAQLAHRPREAVFVVSGCLDYFLSSASHARGQTFFSYIVGGNAAGAYMMESPLPFTGKLVPPGVGMTKNMWGNYAQ